MPELADRLHELQALDIAYRSPDLTQDEIEILDLILRESLDGIRDMGDYLNRRAEIVATPFTGDDRLINAASGDIVGLARGNTSEAFIMTKIKFGFRTVISHINFTMLIGRNRARTAVPFGIEQSEEATCREKMC